MAYHTIRLFHDQIIDYVVLRDRVSTQDDVSLAQSTHFMPDWGSFEGIQIVAPFTDSLASTYINGLTSQVVGYSIYRQKLGESHLHKVVDVDEYTRSVVDYMIADRNQYRWTVVPITAEQVGVSFASGYLSPAFSGIAVSSLEKMKDGFYIANQTWRFTLGADQPPETSELMQNLDTTQFKTLSKYPKTVRGSSNYVSGTATCLLGYINEQTGEYVESPSMLDDWLEFVAHGGLYLYRDGHGKIVMCDIIDSSYHPDYRHYPTRTVLTFSFVENADAAASSVYGWGEHG